MPDQGSDRARRWSRAFRLMPVSAPPVRSVLHLYWRISRGMTLGVRAVVVNAAEEILLVKHSYMPGWYLPGGGVEPGESMAAALARELREEANVELDEAPALHGVFFNARISRRDHVAVYVARRFSLTSGPIRDDEIIDTGFFPRRALPADATPGTRTRIAEVFEGQPLSALW